VPIDVVIDGYNLLHAAGLAKSKYAPGELDRRRARLLARLRDLIDPAMLARTTVVFDARINPPPVRPDPPSGPITVVFAPRDREADDVVEEILSRHSAPHQVLVVSSDHRLHKAARRRGATPIDSDEFLDQLEVDQRFATDSGRRRTSTPEAETAPSLEEELRRRVDEKGDASPPTPAQKPPGSAPEDPLDDPSFWERRIRGGDP